MKKTNSHTSGHSWLTRPPSWNRLTAAEGRQAPTRDTPPSSLARR